MQRVYAIAIERISDSRGVMACISSGLRIAKDATVKFNTHQSPNGKETETLAGFSGYNCRARYVVYSDTEDDNPFSVLHYNTSFNQEPEA